MAALLASPFYVRFDFENRALSVQPHGRGLRQANSEQVVIFCGRCHH
jgi:hypothetical protein